MALDMAGPEIPSAEQLRFVQLWDGRATTFEDLWAHRRLVVQRSDVLRKLRLDLAIPGGLRSAKLLPLSRAAGVAA